MRSSGAGTRASYSWSVANVPPDVVVGREQELTVARELVKGVVGGASAVLLIEGEAGLGKTRLVQQIRDEARAIGACGSRFQGPRSAGG